MVPEAKKEGNMATDPKAEKPKKDKPKKEKKEKLPRHVVRLHDSEKNSLRFTAKQKANGSAISFATHTTREEDGKAKSVRGATANHASFDEAKASVEKGVAAAIKIGWVPRGGAKSTKDTFNLDSLPAPKK